jgi:hypothetical protein
VLKTPTILMTCVLALTAWGLFPRSISGADSALVSRVVDGDTLSLQDPKTICDIN